VWFIRHRARTSTLEAQCRALRKSASLRDELHWNDYPQFSAICNARLSGIVGKLEQKGLTEREIRICVLVLIGFSYAEIAQILFRAESGIGKDKYTIAKHLGVSVKQLRETLLSIAFNHA
jgi:DNA-binding CsgD family transcriptional regulator